MRVQHADIDLLALAGRVAVPQRRQDPDTSVQPGEQVRDRYAHLLRRPVGLAGQAHHAAHRLDQAVVARPRRVRTGLAEPGDRAVDQARKLVPKLLVRQPVLGQRAHLEVLHQHVALLDQPARQLLAFRLRYIQRDRSFVAIDTGKVRALPRPRHVRWREAARIVAAARLFDLDYVGPQIGQHLRTGGTGQHAGQVEDAEPFQGAGGIRHTVLQLLDAGRNMPTLGAGPQGGGAALRRRPGVAPLLTSRHTS